MKRILLPIIALICLAGVRSNAQLSPAYTARLQYVLDSVCARYHIKGASAAVLVPGQGNWTGVHGESYSGHPITSSMAFPLNSNTKTYVAAMMLLLQEDGKLQLSDTIGKWFHNQPNINGQVTIRQLLNHTSGLYSYTDNPDFADSIEADFSRIWQPSEMLQFLKAPVFTPGATWAYCNTNYLLAGMIIAQVTGKPVEQALRAAVLTPQSLNNTWLYPFETPTAVIPHFWFSNGQGGLFDGQIFGYTPEAFYSSASSAGAMFSTALDNVIFWNNMSSGKIVNATSLAEWRSTVTLNSNIGYGLGVFRYKNFNGHVIFEHGGTGAGAINENLVDSVTGVCISVLTNQDSASNSILLNQVVSALHRVTLQPPTSVFSANLSEGIELYPNPVRDELHVSGKGSMRASAFVITDALGHVVSSGQLGSGNKSIQVGALPSGTYFLNLKDESGWQATKTFSIL